MKNMVMVLKGHLVVNMCATVWAVEVTYSSRGVAFNLGCKKKICALLKN